MPLVGMGDGLRAGFFVGAGVGVTVLSIDAGEGLGDGLPEAPLDSKNKIGIN